jgi:hypothetical protein
MLILKSGKTLNLKNMKVSKKLLYPIICLIFLSFYNCGSSADKKVEATVPEELKDTTVLQSDEDNALEKMNNVIDTTQKSK